MAEETIRFNVSDIQHRLRYGRAHEFVGDFVSSPAKNAVFDLEQLGVENPISFYNSCFQAAGRWFHGCKVSRRRKKYIIFEKQ